MIRINLLAVERRPAKRSMMIPEGQRITIVASLILLSTVLLVGWWFWSLRQSSQRVDEDIARAETETQQLRSVLAQVQKFETRKAQLQQRVTLIEQLRRGQTGPVHIVDEISKAIPDRLWLTEITQKGDDLTIAGMTTSLTGVSDFVANLETSSWFKRPIDIIDSQMASDPKTGDLVKFSVKATFANPDTPAPATPLVAKR
ncbi:MAG: PilN domain-containing protein [Acidobacteria bacterium]|nr:PilN domain-containing protein [Acidobacteriota bacterium]